MTRIERVIEGMKKNGLTQLLVSDPMSIRYLTGVYVEPYERMFAFLIKDNGECTFFLNNLFNVPETEFDEIWFSDTDDSVELIAEIIDKEAKLGIDKAWPAGFLIPLCEKCPDMKPVLGSFIVDDCRAIKNEDEIKKMIKASEINDVVITKAAAFVKPGMTEKEVAAFIDSTYLTEGASGNSFTTIVSFGANAADPHHEPDDTVLHEGECVLIDMGCVYEGYCSDMTRTFFCGEPSEEEKKVHDLVREANEKAESVIKPGVRLCDIDAAARDMITKAGYGEEFNHRLGHFIGQTAHEHGDVSSANTDTVKPGMIFSIEPGVYLAGKFGVRVEDLVLVTEDGVKVLNHVDKHWKSVGLK